MCVHHCVGVCVHARLGVGRGRGRGRGRRGNGKEEKGNFLQNEIV